MPTTFTEITALTVKRLRPDPAGEQFIRDTLLPGFGIRIQPSGSASYFAEARVSGTSRTRRKSLGAVSKLTVPAARAAAKTFLGRAALGVDAVAEGKAALAAAEASAEVTWAKVFADFLAGRSLKPRTVQDYDRVRSLHTADWADKPVANIAKADVLAKHKALVEKVGGAQANMVLRVVRAVLAYAEAKYESAPGVPLLNGNPVRVLSKTKCWAPVRPRKGYIHPEDLKTWWAEVGRLDSTARDYLRVAILTGRRRGELSGLSWDNVSLTGRWIRFVDTKNHDDVTVPMGRYLTRLMESRAAARPKASDGNPTPRVFPARVGDGPFTWPDSALERVTEKCGIDVTPHDLRRSFATYADGRVSSLQAKRLMGHKVQDITAQYTQHSVESLAEPMQVLEDYILKAAGVDPDQPETTGGDKVVPIRRASKLRKAS